MPASQKEGTLPRERAFERIAQNLREVAPAIREIRHELHRHPELAGKEFQTAELIRKSLSGKHIELEKPYLQTDVVGLLRGGRPGSNVTLRADMDALPIQERTDIPWKSVNPGRMHACGHDSHVAVLIGTAWLLDQIREELPGSVRFVFQPGEENECLGKKLVEAGALNNPPPAACFGFHTNLSVERQCGAVRIFRNQHTSYLRGFHLTISADAEFRQALNLAKSAAFLAEYFAYVEQLPEDAQTRKPTLLRFGRYSSGTCANVYPTECGVDGSLRYMLEEDGETLRRFHEDFLRRLAEKHGVHWKIEYHDDSVYIPVFDNPRCSELVRKTVEELGTNPVEVTFGTGLASDDFAFYLQKYPGSYFNIFSKPSEGMGAHTAYYDVNDDMLEPALLIMSHVAVNALFELSEDPRTFTRTGGDE